MIGTKLIFIAFILFFYKQKIINFLLSFLLFRNSWGQNRILMRFWFTILFIENEVSYHFSWFIIALNPIWELEEMLVGLSQAFILLVAFMFKPCVPEEQGFFAFILFLPSYFFYCLISFTFSFIFYFARYAFTTGNECALHPWPGQLE